MDLDKFIYTIVENDGTADIVNGAHYVNRIAYAFGTKDIGEISIRYWDDEDK